MKNLLLLLAMCVVFLSCGKDRSETEIKETECRTRETMQLKCLTVHTPAYGRLWAHEECNRTYSSDICY